MIAPKGELANKIPSTYNSTLSSQIDPNAVSENVNMEVPRGRTNYSSTNTSRELSTHSNVSSVPYNIRMELQNNNPTWADQVDSPQDFQLSYECL